MLIAPQLLLKVQKEIEAGLRLDISLMALNILYVMPPLFGSNA